MRQLRGLYLVVDPGIGDGSLAATEAALKGGVDLVQLLGGEGITVGFARRLREITQDHRVPFLVNNDLELAERTSADGLHIDGTHPLPSDVRGVLGKRAVVGFTCGNDVERVRWAKDVGADYVSFCSIFPSKTAGECEIVPLQTVANVRKSTDIPLFASGGITHENAAKVLATGVDGIAVVSAILNARDPEASARRFKQLLSKPGTNSVNDDY